MGKRLGRLVAAPASQLPRPISKPLIAGWAIAHPLFISCNLGTSRLALFCRLAAIALLGLAGAALSTISSFPDSFRWQQVAVRTMGFARVDRRRVVITSEYIGFGRDKFKMNGVAARRIVANGMVKLRRLLTLTSFRERLNSPSVEQSVGGFITPLKFNLSVALLAAFPLPFPAAGGWVDLDLRKDARNVFERQVINYQVFLFGHRDLHQRFLNGPGGCLLTFPARPL